MGATALNSLDVATAIVRGIHINIDPTIEIRHFYRTNPLLDISSPILKAPALRCVVPGIVDRSAAIDRIGVASDGLCWITSFLKSASRRTVIDRQNGATWSSDVVLIDFIPVPSSGINMALDKLGRRVAGASTPDEILEDVEVCPIGLGLRHRSGDYEG